MRKRSSATLLAIAALQASLAQALGLGEITLRSALDQPLQAEIRLRGIGDLDADQILVGLASPADFDRAGVERLYSLSEMRFAVEIGRGGEGVLRVTTERPVREPYLDFVVEVRWPSGRVLREYTVLLDLPTYSPAPAPEVAAPSARPAGTRAAPAERSQWTGSGDAYTVQRNDTLWSIASRSRPDGISVQRMMVAIQRANPEAFIRGNMNLIKAGAVLRIPTDAESVSQAEAVGEIASQAQDWRGDRSAEAAYEPAPATAPSTTAASAGEGYLKLTGDAASASGTAAGGEGEGSGGAPATLAAAQETLAAKEREIAELQARVEALEEQKETYEKLVEVESQGLAGAEQTTTAPPAPDSGAASPKPAAPQPPTPEPGLLERLLGNTMLLAGVLGVAFIAILAFLFKRQRSITTYQPLPEPTQRGAPRKKKGEEAREEPVMRAPEPVSTTTVRPPPVAAAPVAAAAAVQASAPAEPEPSDPISEAEIYIAYGRQERAVEVLERALAADTARSDVRLKLMELHAERDEQSAFMAHYDQLHAAGDDSALANARGLLSRTGNAHWVQELDAPTGVQTGPSEIVPPTSVPQHDEPELARLDVEDGALAADLEFDLDTAFEEPAEAAAPADEELDLELGELELGSGDAALDLGLPGAAAAHEAEPEPALSELAPQPAPAAAPAAPAAEEVEDLGLLEGADEIETKLELARAYIDMGDVDGARDILDEVMSEGSAAQRTLASELLERLRAP